MTDEQQNENVLYEHRVQPHISTHICYSSYFASYKLYDFESRQHFILLYLY